MRNKKWIAALCCGAVILSPISPGVKSQAAGEAKSVKEYIIQADDDKTMDKVAHSYEDEIVIERQATTLLEDQNALVMDLTAEQAKNLDKKSGVTVERNITLSGESAETPNVKDVKRLAKDQWNRAAVGADHVKQASGKKKINVAILDSGIDILSDVKFASQTSLIPEENTDDRTGHGTIISNLIARNENGFCQTGILPEDAAVSLYSVRILDENNQTPLSRAIEGIQWCIDSRMDVINMSFGTEAESEILHEAIRKAEEAGILMVSSVGNSGEKGRNITEYPAGYQEVIGVGSVNEKMERSAFSNTGESVELAAPGENIPVTSYWGLQGSGSGTSYAAAHVTAIAAKIWSENPDRNAREIRVLLDRSATDMGDEEEYGHGLINYECASQHGELADLGKDAEHSEEERGIPKKGGNNNPGKNAQEYDIPISLKASWNSEGHTSLISSLASGLMNTANINAVKAAATYVDTSSTLSDYDILHARLETNYVSTAKCLYEAARAWNGGTNYSALYNVANQ